MNFIYFLLLTAFSIWYFRLDEPRFQTFLEKSKSLLRILGWQQFKVISEFEEESSVVQAHNKIADSLLLSRQKESVKKVFLLASACPQEGKTATAINLALTLAKYDHNVLLIDADLRNPKVNELLGLDMGAGLLELAEKQLSLEDTLKNVEGVWVLTAVNPGGRPISPIDFFGSEKVKSFFRNLREKFDLIIIDSPCIKSHRDALVLTSLADGVVLVVEANKTPRRAILMAQEKIADAKGHLLGIILNKQINPVPSFIQDFLR